MADVSLSMDLQAKALYDDLARVQTHIASFASQTAAHGEKAGRGFAAGFGGRVGEVRSALTGTLGALGIGVGIGAVVSQFNQVIEKGSQIHDLAAKFQITAEQLQLIGNAAALDDVPLEKVGLTLNKLAISGATATKEGSRVNTILKDLKINAETYAAADPAERFLQLSEAYVASGKSGQAYADIAQLIGIRNTAVILTMQQGRTSIDAMGKSMGIMSSKTVSDLDKAGDEIKKFQNQFTVLSANIITGSGKAEKAFYGSADAGHAFLVKLREMVGLAPLAEKLGLVPEADKTKPITPGAPIGPPIEPTNIPPAEGGYGAESRDVYRTGAAETPEESVKRVQEEAVVSERRRHLLNLQSALAEKGLTLGTASATDIGAEEGRLAQKESMTSQADATKDYYDAQQKASDAFFHPGKKLEDELGGLSTEDGTAELEVQTEVLKEIRDNTADLGANQ